MATKNVYFDNYLLHRIQEDAVKNKISFSKIVSERVHFTYMINSVFELFNELKLKSLEINEFEQSFIQLCDKYNIKNKNFVSEIAEFLKDEMVKSIQNFQNKLSENSAN